VNYLVHLYLADRSQSSLVGNLLGDFVKGPLEGVLPEFRAGVALHRAVDTFAEGHASFRASKRRIEGQRRRFAGIIVDMCYDHFLARDWDEHSETPLVGFTQRVYAALEGEEPRLPERLRTILPRMKAEDWLASYRRPEIIGVALDSIAKRLRRGERLRGSVEELHRHYAELEGDFRVFLPDALAFAQAHE
jgi:acyl carrier protein phosphodiesterase